MSFKNETNEKRVDAMIEKLALILKSAKANKADKADIVELLAPLTGILKPLLGTGTQSEPEQEEPERPAQNKDEAPFVTMTDVYDALGRADTPVLFEFLREVTDRLEERDLKKTHP